MPARNRPTTQLASVSRRTQVVWMAFLAAMGLVSLVLALGEDGLSPGIMVIVPAAAADRSDDPIFDIDAPLDRDRWTGIVIHHSGGPAGNAAALHRQHLAYGYAGLGYHFIVGNGNGLDDGVIEVGYRWNEQKPGAHVIGPDAAKHNQRSIGICLIGNGGRRPFTGRQVQQLVVLVRHLQRELDIPASAVRLHDDVAPGVGSPGAFFPAAEVREQLLN